MLPQPRALIHNDYQSIVGEFRRHQPAIQPAATPHILQQKLIPVTSDFLSQTTFFVWQKQGRW